MLMRIVTYMVFGRVKVISEKIENILNEQINKEFYSSYLYLAISAYFDERGLKGFSHWTRVQAREEIDHAMILFDHMLEREGKINLLPINEIHLDALDTPLSAFEFIYKHEKAMTESINNIAKETDIESDYATRHFINWYISEQVEEEDNIRDIISKLNTFGEDKNILFHIDKELKERKYNSHSYK